MSLDFLLFGAICESFYLDWPIISNILPKFAVKLLSIHKKPSQHEDNQTQNSYPDSSPRYGRSHAGTVLRVTGRKWTKDQPFSFNHLNTFFSGLPFASSSTSLSSCRIFFVNGSSIVSTRTPQIVPVIRSARGFQPGALERKSP